MSNELNPHIAEFCRGLAQLSVGERARLKRCAGKTLVEAPASAWRVFYCILPPETKPYEEEIFFLVATLYPLTESGGKGNFGAAMRRIRPTKDDEAQGLDRLMQLLLDAQGERLSFLLRQSVRRLADHEIPVNWPNLLADLLKWNDRERRVQNRWARNYFLNTKERKLLASAPQNAEQI